MTSCYRATGLLLSIFGGENQFHPRPDGIAVGGLSIPAKFEGDELPSGRGVIPEETKTGCGPVCYPDVQVAIEVPVNGGEAPAIIGKAKSAEGGHVCETCRLASGIQEGAVAFVAAEGPVFVKEPAECPPTLFVGSDGALGEIINRGLRHDLSPIDTSQVASILGGDEAIGDEDIVPAIIVEIYELGAPGPASHVDPGLESNIPERLACNALK